MTKKGERYECGECGLVVLVEDPCGCYACDLMCCGQQMKPSEPAPAAKEKPKKAAVKAKK